MEAVPLSLSSACGIVRESYDHAALQGARREPSTVNQGRRTDYDYGGARNNGTQASAGGSGGSRSQQGGGGGDGDKYSKWGSIA
eukprot:10740-Heterococcus_DN1.PRE.6